nr:helicase-related protein [Pseudomonas sp. GM_Psu_2]
MRAIEEVSARKAFVFYSRIAQSKRFAIALRAVAAGGDFWANHIDGSLPSWQRTRLLHQYGRSTKGALSCVRCLAEGVDVPDTDLAAFMHQRESHIDIVQALGRVVGKARGARQASRLCLHPFALAAQERRVVGAGVARSDMSTIWRTLAAIAEQDDVMLNEVHRAAIESGETGATSRPGWFSKLHVVGPAPTGGPTHSVMCCRPRSLVA